MASSKHSGRDKHNPSRQSRDDSTSENDDYSIIEDLFPQNAISAGIKSRIHPTGPSRRASFTTQCLVIEENIGL